MRDACLEILNEARRGFLLDRTVHFILAFGAHAPFLNQRSNATYRSTSYPFLFVFRDRLASEERTQNRVDPNHPKVQWPTPELCPRCLRPGDIGAGVVTAGAWVEPEVYKFLIKFYGRYARGHHNGIFSGSLGE